MKLVNNNGFTLAEVLITLGIIGVVAALTIPTLMSKQNDKANVVKLQKAYSVLSQAYKLYEADNGPIVNDMDGAELNDVADKIAQKLSYIKYCKLEAGCFPDVYYKHLNGDDFNTFGSSTYLYKVVLKDGTLIAFDSSTSASYDGKNDVNQIIYVDIN